MNEALQNNAILKIYLEVEARMSCPVLPAREQPAYRLDLPLHTCQKLQEALQVCREDVATAGSGHCMEHMKQVNDCLKQKDLQELFLSNKCGQLWRLKQTLNLCSQSNSSSLGPKCKRHMKTFELCVKQALS